MPLDAALASVVEQILVDLDTPRSLTVMVLINHEEWDQLANLRADPAHYPDADSYFRAAASTELLRKCQDIDTTVDRTENALRGWLQSERDCCQTNLKLKPFLENGPFEDPRDLVWADFLADVKGWITTVLGKFPDMVDGRFGPGATFGDRGGRTTVCHKMSSRPTVTQGAKAFAEAVVAQTAWQRARITMRNESQSDYLTPQAREYLNRHCAGNDMYLEPLLVGGNRFTTALKDALKHRGISIEASENIFCQLGVGGEMRGRLRRVGIDLEEGQAVHRLVACEASKTGRYATLDLSSASDTVSRNLVKLLMPDEWYSALDSLRSPRTCFSGKEWQVLKRILSTENESRGNVPGPSLSKDGEAGESKWFYLEKFSSMGNGFTFELETLIFLGLAVQTAKKLGVNSEPGVDIFVYGDDIIVPVEVAVPLTKVLRWCGFTLNERKSFITGPFRESCGGDYFNGQDVRPYYLKEFPNDAASWISMANGIRRLATTNNRSGFDRLPLKRGWFRALGNIPGHVRRLRGPVQLGDSVIHDTPENWSTYWKGQTRYFKVWKAVSTPIPLARFGGAVQLASALYGVLPEGPIPRGSVGGYRLGRIAWTIMDERSLTESRGPSYIGPWIRRRGRSLYESLLLLLSVDR